MKNNYYSVYSKGRNYKNLIDLRSRPIEERREIARKGGLARQEQRRQHFKMQRNVRLMFEVYGILEEHKKKVKSNKVRYYKDITKTIEKNKNTFINAFNNDLQEAYNCILEDINEEEKLKAERRKAQRKAINHRYYIKHRKKTKK